MRVKDKVQDLVSNGNILLLPSSLRRGRGGGELLSFVPFVFSFWAGRKGQNGDRNRGGPGETGR